MSSTLILAFIATFLLGIFWVLKKIIVNFNISPFTGAFFIYLGGLIFMAISFFLIRPELKFSAIDFKKGIILALVAGALIALFDALNLLILKRGINIAFLAPWVTGGSVLIASLAGILFLKETISPVQFLGILAIISGIFLLTR